MTDTAMMMIPASMAVVSQDEFFAALKADPRDIMPSHTERERTKWRVVRTGAVWGVSTPGWANPGDPKCYAIQEKA